MSLYGLYSKAMGNFDGVLRRGVTVQIFDWERFSRLQEDRITYRVAEFGKALQEAAAGLLISEIALRWWHG